MLTTILTLTIKPQLIRLLRRRHMKIAVARNSYVEKGTIKI